VIRDFVLELKGDSGALPRVSALDALLAWSGGRPEGSGFSRTTLWIALKDRCAHTLNCAEHSAFSADAPCRISLDVVVSFLASRRKPAHRDFRRGDGAADEGGRRDI
jgi:hypothetical protein